MVEKFRESALETDLGFDLFHILFDPRNFGQAGIVDFIGGQRQRRGLFDGQCI